MASSSTPAQTAAQHMAQRHQALQQQQQQQQQQGHTPSALSDPSFLSAQQALNVEDNPPVRVVQIAALVVMKIIKQCRDFFPSPSSGHLLGLDVSGTLQITNSYPLPSSNDELPPGAPNLETERRRQQALWIKSLSEVNVDNNIVGWYQSAYLGSFMNTRVVEGLVAAGANQMLNDNKAVLIIHDVSKSASGPVSLRAFRLTASFLAAHKEGKFTVESLAKHNLTHRDILEELPLEVHNSHLITALLHSLPASAPTLHPNYDTLDLSLDPYLERNLECLVDGMDEWTYEQGNLQYFQRQMGREQAKIAAWQARRKAENVTRAAAGQPPLPEDEWIKLFKLPAEPSRLESLLISSQIDQYCKQIDNYSSSSMMKMFALKGMPVVDS